MRILIIFIFFISSTMADEAPNIKNIVINKELKTYDNIAFLDMNEKIIKLSDYKGSLVLLNFWATWCAPCRKEMPSLDKLKLLNEFSNVDIIPINIGGDTKEKSIKFFQDVNIRNLEIFSGSGQEFSEKFKIRGLPTTILIDKNGYEFARIVGYIDFENKSFLDWLNNNL